METAQSAQKGSLNLADPGVAQQADAWEILPVSKFQRGELWRGGILWNSCLSLPLWDPGDCSKYAVLVQHLPCSLVQHRWNTTEANTEIEIQVGDMEGSEAPFPFEFGSLGNQLKCIKKFNKHK